LWAISLLPELVGGIHAFARRAGKPVFAFLPRRIGVVTSGGFGPTLNHPIAMGYVATGAARPDTPMGLMVRGRPLPAKVQTLPFVPARYVRHR
jgi:aminomethyltransferase